MMSQKTVSVLLPLALGVILGEAFTISAAFLFMVGMTALSAYLISRSFDDGAERGFILSVFFAGLLIRFLLCVGLYFFCELKGAHYSFYGYKGNCIFGDSAFASVHGLWISQFWKGALKPIDTDPSFFMTPISSNPYIYAVFYYIFGFKEFSAKLIDVLLGSISPVLAYLLTKEIFSKRAARIACVLTAFFPSLILWSVTNLRETKQIFLSLIIMLLSVKLLKRPPRVRETVILLASFVLLYSLRPEFALLLFVAVSAGVYLAIPMPFRRKVLVLAAAGLLMASITFYRYGIDPVAFAANKVRFFVAHLAYRQATAFFGSGINYRIHSDDLYASILQNYPMLQYHYSFLEESVAVVRGWAYLLLTPFPWRAANLNQLSTVPHMIGWYILLFFSFIGIRYALVQKRWISLPLLAFIVIVTTVFGLVSGNIGTAFRHRDIVTPVFLIFSSAGIAIFFEKKAGVDG